MRKKETAQISKDMDISLHSTVRLLKRSDTFVLVVSVASPVCICVRNNSQQHTSEYV